MNRQLLFWILFSLTGVSVAQPSEQYESLDPHDPIGFGCDHIVYQGDTILLGPKAFFIDGQFSEEEADSYPFVYHSVNEAVKHLTDGTEEVPMTLYLAPYVYWLDDPDDPEIRVPKEGSSTPYALEVECEWLRFYGLTQKPENVVLAANRGQTIGAKGNFTLFRFSGDGTSSENVTFGNYCNLDLVFPLKPELNREKRASAIVQAQLIHCNGDKIVARNTHFLSRLNLCPFVGGKRVLFDNCHFESTDDALCGTGVYLNSTLEFYSSKPFYHTRGTGAVFLNCDIKSFTRGRQYFTKANGQVAVVDTRFDIDEGTYIGWRDIPPAAMRNYQFQVQKNENPVIISEADVANTVEMDGKPVLDAYRFVHEGEVVYNVYNLLRGDDDWDPMNQKELVQAAEQQLSKPLTDLPVQLSIRATKTILETGQDSAILVPRVMRFGNYPQTGVPVRWSIAPEHSSFVKLRYPENGPVCGVIPTNATDSTRTVIVKATTASGLEAAVELVIAPAMLPAPKFSAYPRILSPQNGSVKVGYRLRTDYEDQSLVTWYRCTDAGGRNPIPVAVSRGLAPILSYPLSVDDIGYYLKVSVEPDHIRCEPGEAVFYTMLQPIVAADVKAPHNRLETDFLNFPTSNQPEVIPGFWTLRHFDPADTTEQDAWLYGEGRNGAYEHVGLLQGRSANLGYTPSLEKAYGDMSLTLEVAPFKSAGQGFSIADLYMDVLIKYDARTESGYGIRFIRTTKYGNAVDAMLVKYDHGTITKISEAVTTSCYRTLCTITVKVEGNRLIAHAKTDDPDFQTSDRPDIVSQVNLEAEVEPRADGGFGVQYNGGASAVMEGIRVQWK